MDLIDEVDYHCCIFCDKIFTSEYELLLHVSESHQAIVDLNPKLMNTDDDVEFNQSTYDDEDSIHCDEYLEMSNNKSPSHNVKHQVKCQIYH